MLLTTHTFVTADGVMQAPGGPEEDRSGQFAYGGWMAPYADEVFGEVVDGWFSRTTALLFGRTTYQVMAGYWPQVTDPDNPVAARLNTVPKHVVSTTLRPQDATWSGTESVFGDDVAQRVRAIKESGDGELQVHGSWQLVQTLHQHGLVDEYRVIQFPVVVGGGKRLFAEGVPASGFEVSDVRPTTLGAVAMTMRPVPFRSADHAVVDGKDTVVDR